MPHAAATRRVQPEDRLFRKLRPHQWDPDTLFVDPQAFIDKYERQSFYVERFTSPRGVLEFFCRLAPVRRQFGGRTPLPEDLFKLGHDVAVIPVAAIIELGLHFVPELDGSEIREDGHVNVDGARSYAPELAEQARALSRIEIFPDYSTFRVTIQPTKCGYAVYQHGCSHHIWRWQA